MKGNRLITRYERLTPQMRLALEQKYPFGFERNLVRVGGPKPFYGVILEFENMVYLVKMQLNKVFGSEADSAPQIDEDDVHVPDNESPDEDFQYD